MIQASLPRRSTPALDLGAIDLNGLARQALKPWSEAYDQWLTGVDALVKPLAKPSQGDCGCPTCRPDPCACRCCVTDADLVVEARVGEQRVVPIILENPWRRERDIELELSSWTAIGGDIAVRGEIATPTAFGLAPCGREEIVLLLRVTGGAAVKEQTQAAGKAAEKGPNERIEAETVRGERRLPDVTRCEVAYADLRIKGCDMRSIRIAVAVLPRDCEAYTVDCGCACCC
ncbi:hypothetical protein [Phenylobacterium sp.]|uniref:hypothetical protein n=1 Tax=Phenylobacterium sp. TaxID=1871053 RepID=UPI0025D4E9FE|nr:hypothetical protein [Phenylobacterium sp.]MBX3484893.1 hypothetical protein [Phenylobacterium sp.]MCW5760930.1 hypothetical protein [Phenylobacterium sp.]